MGGATVNQIHEGPKFLASLAVGTYSLYIDGVVNGRPRILLLNTGATMTILSQEAAVGGSAIILISQSLQMATGDHVEVYWRGSCQLPHRKHQFPKSCTGR